MTSHNIIKASTLGELLLIANPSQLVGVYFVDQKHYPAIPADWKLDPKHPVLRQAGKELTEYFAGKRAEFSVPLHFAGTSFQNEIWRQISIIPFGETITYSELARRAGAPDAVRAAGTATGRNPLGIIIPCHRVVGKNGALGGYAGGLDRKQHLLKLEMNQLALRG